MNSTGAGDELRGENGVPAEETAENGEEIKEFPPPQFNFVISTDSMTAYLRIALFHRDQRVTREEILSAVEKQGIVYGIDEAEIDHYLGEENFFKELRVASGLRPVKGENGQVTFHFKTRMTGMPKEREDGSVDFKDLDIVQNVSEGDLLCTLTRPKAGTDGTDIFGKTVKAAPGDMPPVPTGSKIRMNADETEILAAADGGINFKNNTIEIEAVLTIKENVGVETGNINYNGSVLVYGNVNEGYSVTAKEDITVNGIVEGAELRAGGNILIRNGINGMNKADVFAAGDVSSVFVENAKIKCGNNIYSNAIMNSEVRAGNAVILRGKRGALLGGRCYAGSTINVKTFGNDKNIQQDVTVEPLWYEYEKMGFEQPPENPDLRIEKLHVRRERLLEQSSKISSETAKLQRSPREYEKPLPQDEKQRKMREIILKKSKVTQEIADIDKEIKDITELYRGREFKVICIGQAFPGTRIDIGGARYKVTTMMQNQKFTVDKGEVVLGQILPHEADAK